MLKNSLQVKKGSNLVLTEGGQVRSFIVLAHVAPSGASTMQLLLFEYQFPIMQLLDNFNNSSLPAQLLRVYYDARTAHNRLFLKMKLWGDIRSPSSIYNELWIRKTQI